MNQINKYMSIKDFSKLAGVSVQAVHKAIRKGRVKDVQRVGYVYLISRKEIKRFETDDPQKGE